MTNFCWGIYIKNGLDYRVRDDLALNSPGNFEVMFVEIILSDRKNLVVGCIYRHPSSAVSVSDFASKHLEPVLCKIGGERKECALMGDFNVDLLKCSDSNAAGEFYNGLSSHFGIC